MKLLPVLVTLSVLVALASARYVPVRWIPTMLKGNGLRYSAVAQPMSIMEAERFSADGGENYHDSANGGVALSGPGVAFKRSLNRQFVPFMDNAMGGYQPESDALPWNSY